MGVPRGKLAAIAEPADVAEVCGRLLQSRHPWVVHQCESHPALAQQLGEVRADPTPVAYLDGVSRSLGQFAQESAQGVHALDGKVRRELEEQGTEPVSQALHGADEAFGLAAAINEVSLMRQIQRKLSSEEEPPGRDLAPTFDGCLSRSTVESRVYLYRREVLDVFGEPSGGSSPWRVDRTLPVCVGPAAGAQVQALLRRRALPGVLFEQLGLLGIFHRNEARMLTQTEFP